MSCGAPFASSSGYGNRFPRRVGSTVDWTGAFNAAPGPDVATAGPIGSLATTNWLYGDTFAPSPPLPTTPALSDVKVRVRHRRTPADGRAIYLDAIESRTSTFTPNVLVPTVMTDYEYSMGTLTLTPFGLNAGIYAQISYKSGAGSDPFTDPANWIITQTPNNPTPPTPGPAYTTSLGTINYPLTFTIGYTWNPTTLPPGTSPPSTLLISIEATARVGFEGTPSTEFDNASGPGTVDNGIGATASGTAVLYPGVAVAASSMIQRTLNTSSGSATTTVPMMMTISGDGIHRAYATGNVTHSIVGTGSGPSTVEVESFELVACTVDGLVRSLAMARLPRHTVYPR